MSDRHLKPVPTIRIDADGVVGDTGKTLDELTAEAAADPPFMRGSSRQLSFDVGGRADDLIGSRLKIPSGDYPLLGQFPQGKRVRVILELEIEDIHFKSVRDREGMRVGRDRIHQAVVIDQPKIDQPKK